MGRYIISDKKTECNKCGQLRPAYYTHTNGVKGLWIQCPKCGTHAKKYIANLDLPQKHNGVFVDKDASKEVIQKKVKGFKTNHPTFRFKQLTIFDTPEKIHKKLVLI